MFFRIRELLCFNQRKLRKSRPRSRREGEKNCMLEIFQFFILCTTRYLQDEQNISFLLLHNPSTGVPTVVKTNILIRSMGPVSELNMVRNLKLIANFSSRARLSTLFRFSNVNSRSKDYSMDIYFRQYWRDARLSFKSPINRLSLSIKVSTSSSKWK